MDWKEVTIYTTTAGIGPVEAVLDDNGVQGYVLEDAADFGTMWTSIWCVKSARRKPA